MCVCVSVQALLLGGVFRVQEAAIHFPCASSAQHSVQRDISVLMSFHFNFSPGRLQVLKIRAT